jgi:ABC-type multidrug transport system fused ATPase/permease subunit
MDGQNYNIDSTTDGWNKIPSNDHSTRYDPNETPTVNSTNPNYHSTSSTDNYNWEKTTSTIETAADKAKGELKKGQQHAEDIITKSKRLIQQQWEQTRHSIVQLQKKIKEMVPKQANNLIYWQNPIQSGIVFTVLLSVIITFMFLSSLAAVSFWLLASLLFVGLYKLYNYVMATFVGRVQDDIFDSIFSSDIHISERQAQALANSIRANGTTVLRQARTLFLWNNLTNSIIFGLVLFVFFYIGLSMNALTFALVGLIFLFTVPKIYQVYQVPIDRVAKQILDQINQLLSKITTKLPTKPKKA